MLIEDIFVIRGVGTINRHSTQEQLEQGKIQTEGWVIVKNGQAFINVNTNHDCIDLS